LFELNEVALIQWCHCSNFGCLCLFKNWIYSTLQQYEI